LLSNNQEDLPDKQKKPPTKQQQPHILVSFYVKLYTNKYNKTPMMNRYRDKWSMLDVIDSVGFQRVFVLLEYYFKTTNPGHPFSWFLNNFDELDKTLTEKEKDIENRKKLREETRKMVQERELNEH
jgi:hypothetical protein